MQPTREGPRTTARAFRSARAPKARWIPSTWPNAYDPPSAISLSASRRTPRLVVMKLAEKVVVLGVDVSRQQENDDGDGEDQSHGDLEQHDEREPGSREHGDPQPRPPDHPVDLQDHQYDDNDRHQDSHGGAV